MRWIRIVWSTVRSSRISRAVAISLSFVGLVAYMAMGSNFSLSKSSKSLTAQSSLTKFSSNFQDCSVSAATNNVGTCILTNPNLNITSYSISYVYAPAASDSSVGSLSISLPDSLVPTGISVNSYIWICTSSSSLEGELSGSAAYCATGGSSGKVFSTSGPIVTGSGSSAIATYTFPLPFPTASDLFWMLHFDANNGDTLEVAPSVSVSTTSSTATGSLTLSKTESPSSPNPITKAGQSVTYDFAVTNTGNTTLYNLAITDAQSVPGKTLNAPISCPATSLAAGASVTCTGSYTVTSTDITNAKVTDTAVATATTSTGTSVTSNHSTLTIPVSVPTTSSKTVTPKTTTKTVTPITKSSSTAPTPVKLVTGPPAPPASSTNALPLGAGIAGLGIAALGYLVIERKRNNQHGSTDEVA